MYSLIRPLLFKLNPEFTHHLALASLKLRFQLLSSNSPANIDPITLFNHLHFPNRIGLAAGFDKNGDYIDALSSLGFGFLEIGTLTPKPQQGNPKPRLFRLAKEKAIINRMGFNNKGIDYAAKQLTKINYKGILGINIGKNKDTPLSLAYEDYLACMRKLWPFASYFTINISSPNTPNLRDLQNEDTLKVLLNHLKAEQRQIHTKHKKYIPLVIKIAPDLTSQEITTLANLFLSSNIDGIIATNTTIQRFNIESPHSQEIGGLSGLPLNKISTGIIKQLYAIVGDKIPIIASGGIMSEIEAKEKLAAGASLLQLYTGMIYKGPGLINQLTRL